MLNNSVNFGYESPEQQQRRMQLAQAMQMQEQPQYKRYKGPMGAPTQQQNPFIKSLFEDQEKKPKVPPQSTFFYPGEY